MKSNQFFLSCSMIACVIAFSSLSCDQKVKAYQYEEVMQVVKSNQSSKGSMMDMPMSNANTNKLVKEMRDAGSMDMKDQAAMLQNSVANVALKWDLPEGWIATEGSAMRLASFTDAANTFDCSIVSLGGSAGGLEANIVRWMRQVEINSENVDINEFIKNQQTITMQGDLKGTMVDLTSLQNEEDAFSMVAASIQGDNHTIFVKMSGTRKNLIVAKSKFISLCQSLRYTNE